MTSVIYRYEQLALVLPRQRQPRGCQRVRPPSLGQWAQPIADFFLAFGAEEFLPVPRTSVTFPARVFAKVDVTAGCWWRRGAASPAGYGVVGRGARGTGTIQAHCAVWHLLVGPIPRGMHYDHLCRNPPCVNPEHGEIVTPEENKRRGFSQAVLHSLRPTCPEGHPKDGMLGARGGPRHRYCKTCARRRSSARYHARRNAA